MMDRGGVLLQALLRRLRLWEPYITRTTRAALSVEPRTGGEFALVLTWKNRDGTAGRFVREYTKPYVFGLSYALGPAAWRVEQRVCEHARDLARAVLQERGVA